MEVMTTDKFMEIAKRHLNNAIKTSGYKMISTGSQSQINFVHIAFYKLYRDFLESYSPQTKILQSIENELYKIAQDVINNNVNVINDKKRAKYIDQIWRMKN